MFAENRLRYKLFLFPLLFAFFHAFAQKGDNFGHLTVEQGLSQSAVLSIAQDSMGFMWFGTKDGLNRYDSRTIEIYRSKPNDKKSLSSSININTLLVDSKGFLWVGTQNGLNKYLAETNTFNQFLNSKNNRSSLSNNVIRYLYKDREENIWVGTEKGLNKVLPDDSFERFETEKYGGQGMTSDFIKAIYQDKEGVMWLGTPVGLMTMTRIGKNYVFKLYTSDRNNENTISGNDISAIVEDKKGRLWVGTRSHGFNLFDRKTKQFIRLNTRKGIGLYNDDIRKITVDKDGRLWIATLYGVNIYNPETNRVERYFVNEPENQYSLTQNSIYDIYQDKLGSTWIGTYYGGVNVIHNLNFPFNIYQHFSYKNSLSSNIVSAIVEDKQGGLWIGTEAEGINYYDRKTKKFSVFKNVAGQINSLSSNLIKDLAFDEEGKLWATTFEGGLNVYDPRTNQFKTYRVAASPSLNRLSALLIDSRQQIWVGSRNGLYLYDKAREQFQLMDLPHCFVYYLMEDRQGKLWISTDLGVFLKRPSSSKFVNITLKKNPSWFLRVNAITEDSRGKIWFASNVGAFIYDQSDRSVKQYTENQGLPANNIIGVLEDDQKHMWFSTTKGLAKFENGVFKVYNTSDGLTGNVFNYNSFFKDSKGELFFGGFNGMLSFKPEKILKNRTKPNVFLTKLRLADQEVFVNDTTNILGKSIWNTSKIGIPYRESVFSLDFSTLNYISSNKNKYAYKLDGIDKKWNELETPVISFNKLSDGDYTLLYKGSNNDGLWSDTKSLKITIYPPLWKTWWAYSFYLVIIAAVAFVSIRYFLMRALLRKEHEIHQLKIDFFRNVSHEIRTPLTLILGPLEKILAEEETNSKVKYQLLGVNKHVKRLSRLVNELLDFSKVEAGKMILKVEKINLVDFVYDIYESFLHVANEHKINYEFSSPDPVIEAYVDKGQMEKVIYNLLSNAFKFTPNEGKILVRIEEDDKGVFVRIIDSGKGIAKENRSKIFTDFYQENADYRNIGTGIGLVLSRSIARLHHGDLDVEDHEINTVFRLYLKKGFAHLDNFQMIDNEEYELNPYEFSREVDPVEELMESAAHLPSILIVEDNKEVRDFVVKSMKDRYRMFTAEDGGQGLLKALEHIPDIIISDVMMPVMDGIELCEKIKTDERLNHIPVVLLTARAGEIDELIGLKTGADAYVTKPFTLERLRYTVSNLVALQEAMRSRFSRKFTLEPHVPNEEHPDEKFIAKVLRLLETNIGNPNFGVNDFASEIGMSTPIFYKKIKAITGLTVNNFMKSFRLKRAAQLIEQKHGTISEIAYIVGFTDPKYFSKEFKKQFGKTPSDYL